MGLEERQLSLEEDTSVEAGNVLGIWGRIRRMGEDLAAGGGDRRRVGKWCEVRWGIEVGSCEECR